MSLLARLAAEILANTDSTDDEDYYDDDTYGDE